MQELGLNQQVSDGHILKFSGSYGSKWKLMPACLNLKSIVAEDIDRSPKSEEEKRYTFFSTWKQVKGSSATYKDLIIALLEIGCGEDADRVCELVPQFQEQDPPAAPKSAVPAAALPSAVAEKFSVSMTPGQLHDWLRSRQMPLADCKKIKGTCEMHTCKFPALD